MPRPEIGRPLPRAADAYVEQPKWHGYVLADDGHGQEWRRVFRVGRSQADELWQAVARAVLDAPVTEVRTGPRGVGCGIHMILSFNGRTATSSSAGSMTIPTMRHG